MVVVVVALSSFSAAPTPHPGPLRPRCFVDHVARQRVHARIPHTICLLLHGPLLQCGCWAEARIKITRMTLTIKLDRNWSSFQLANSTPPLSVTGSAIAPSARILDRVSLLTLHHATCHLLAVCKVTSNASIQVVLLGWAFFSGRVLSECRGRRY